MRSQSVLINAVMWERCITESLIFKCGKVYYSNPFIIKSWDSSIGIVTIYGMDDWMIRVRFLAGGNLSL
jgi:hypothetical protein